MTMADRFAPGLRPEQLQGWHAAVTVPALASSRLVFALCMAFAAPLALALGLRPMCFNLYGRARQGADANARDVALELAAALYGDMGSVRFWADAVRDPWALSSEVLDGLLVIKDHDKVPARSAMGAASALWLDGSSEGLSPRSSSRRDALTLSTSDALIDHDAMRLIGGPGAIWLLNIPFSAPDEVLPGASILVQALRMRGEIGLAWLHLVNTRADLKEQRFLSEVGPRGEVRDRFTQLRWCDLERHFDLIMGAGEMATRHGLTGWPEGAAQAAVIACLNAWAQATLQRALLTRGVHAA